jgi:hypothetical protein
MAGQVMALVPGPAGPLHGVPALPAGYLARAELGGLRAALLGAGAVGLTGDVPGLSMYGQGGIGKTVLAAATAHDPVVRAHSRTGCSGSPPGKSLTWPGSRPAC